MVWFCIITSMNLLTAFLSPPVAMAAYYLKGVAPDLELKDIYWGMLDFMWLQCLGLILVMIFSPDRPVASRSAVRRKLGDTSARPKQTVYA